MSLLRKLIYASSILIVCAIAFAFASCKVALPIPPATTVQPRIVVTEPERKTTTSNKRTTTSRRSSGDKCEGDDDCEEMCEDLFSSRSKREDCEELDEDIVDGMFTAFNDRNGYLEDPDEDDLEDIHPDAVENALDIDERVWTDLIKDYSSSQAKRVLYWIATNKEIYDAMDSSLDEDDLEDIFEQLISENVRNQKFYQFIEEELEDDDEDNFINLAYDDGSDAASFIIERAVDDCEEKTNHKLITEEDHRKPACLLEVLCDHKDSRNNYIFEDSFDYILSDVGDLRDYIEDGKDGLVSSSSCTGNDCSDSCGSKKDPDAGSGSNIKCFSDGLEVDDRDSDDLGDVCEAADAQGLF